MHTIWRGQILSLSVKVFLLLRDPCDVYEGTRTAREANLPGIKQLLHPLEESGVLIRRSNEELLEAIGSFIVLEREGQIIACALPSFPFLEQNVMKLLQLLCLLNAADKGWFVIGLPREKGIFLGFRHAFSADNPCNELYDIVFFSQNGDYLSTLSGWVKAVWWVSPRRLILFSRKKNTPLLVAVQALLLPPAHAIERFLDAEKILVVGIRLSPFG